MGVVLLVLLAGIEIALAAWTIRKARGKGLWHKNRVISRGMQVAIVLIAMLLPFGQKWRLMPPLGVLLVLLAAACIVWFINHKKETAGERRTPGLLLECAANILLLLFILLPALIFTGYKGLPTSGAYKVEQASVILIDGSRKDPFEKDGSKREVPVHFYYPAVSESGTESFPLGDHGGSEGDRRFCKIKAGQALRCSGGREIM